MNEVKENLALKRYQELLPNMADYISLYAKQRKKETALIEFDTGETVTWKAFNTSVNAFAAKLLSMGLSKGDIIATSLPLLKEHVYLIYACYRIGVIIAPIDLRLKAGEIQYCFDRIKPKAYFFLGKTPVADFRPIISEVMAGSPYIENWIQFQKEEDLIMDGATGITEFVKDIKKIFIKSLFTGSVNKARSLIGKRDPCLIIFTTGSTGSPKPALICHENILIQNIGLAVGFEMIPGDRMLVNLPPSHVGCITEQLATTIYVGGTSVLLHVFDPAKSLQAIEKHGVTVIGQIPALFNLEWQLSDYSSYNLSSLRFILYGGQAVPVEFLKKMQAMAPKIGTGLGLTETAGFCTFTDTDDSVEDIAAGIGFDMGLTPISIREPMNDDGTAGSEKGPGETGEICFSGPQVFLGYYDDEQNTARALSKDRVCYTGDLGFYDEKGLHFVGRAKFVIKPKGYQVYPQDINNHISSKLKGRASNIACVGADHDVFIEAIVAFVEEASGQKVTAEDVMDACRDISSYSRPSHVVILPPGTMPLNRVAKVDYMALKNMAGTEVEKLRESGRWDRAGKASA